MNPLKKLNGLLEQLDVRLADNLEYPDLRNLRGVARACAGDLDGALEDVKMALRVNLHYAEALMNLVWLHTLRNEPGAVQALLEGHTLERLSETNQAHCRFLQVFSFESAEAALKVLDSLPVEQQDSNTLFLDRLYALVSLGSVEQLQGLVEAKTAEHKELAPHFEQLELCLSSGDPQAAWQEWADLYGGNPGIGNLLSHWSSIQDLQHSEFAEELLHSSVVITLDISAYHLAIGMRHDFQGSDEKAEIAFRNAQQYDPQSVQPRVQLGFLLASMGRVPEAIEELKHAVVLQPRYADVRHLLGQLHEELGNVGEAEKQFREALSSNPQYILARLALGSLLEKQHRDAESIQMLEGARRSGVHSMDLERMLEQAYARTGQREEAQRARQRIVKLELAS